MVVPTVRERFSSAFGPLWGSVGRGSAALATSTIVGGALVYLATPLVTRVFDPAALGDYGVYLAFVAILSAIASRKYEEAIPLPSSDEDAWSLVRSVVANALRFCLLLTAIISLAFVGRAVGMWHVHLPIVMWVVPIGIFFAVGQAAVLRWAVRKERYAPSMRARIAQGASMAAGQPALGVATGMRSGAIGALPLACADALSTGLGFFMLVRGSTDRAVRPKLFGLGRDDALLRRYRPFMTAGLPAALINVLTLQIPFLVVAATYGSTDAGQFALVERLLLTPISVITSAVTMVLVRQSALRMDDPTHVRSMFTRMSLFLALLGLPLLVISAVALGPLIGRIFGASWAEAGEMLRPLAILYFTNLVATPWGAAVHSAQRQDVYLVREVVRLVLIAGGAAVVLLTTPSLITGISILAGVGTISYVWYFVICSWALNHPRPTPGPVVAENVQETHD